MTTLFEPYTSTYMIFEDKLIQIIELLEKGQTILLPTGTSWKLASAANIQSQSFQKAIQSKLFEGTLTLMLDNILTMRKVMPHLHPRVETLLTILERPFGIISSAPKQFDTNYLGVKNEWIYTLPNNAFCTQLIELLGQPLHLLTIKGKLDKPISFSDITEETKQAADYICLHGRTSKALEWSIFGFNNEGELQFYDEELKLIP